MGEHLTRPADARFGSVFTKLRVWEELEKYHRVIIPCVTPFRLLDTTHALLRRLVKQVAQIVTTDGVDGWTYGTLLALELNKGAENVAALERLLNHELSTLDFMFLQRFRSMQLATLRSDEHSARTFTYTHDQTNGAHLILETECAQNDRCVSPEQSGWIMCSCDVPEAHRVPNRSPAITVCMYVCMYV